MDDLTKSALSSIADTAAALARDAQSSAGALTLKMEALSVALDNLGIEVRAALDNLAGEWLALSEDLARILNAAPVDPPDPDPVPDPVLPPPGPVVTFPGQKEPRHERIRPFRSASAYRLHPSQGPLEVQAGDLPAGADIALEPGVWQLNDFRALRGQYLLGLEGAEKTTLTGDFYGVRAKDPTCDDVTIGGVTFRGFCKGSTNALAAAVSPRWSDTLFRTAEEDWYGGQPKNWVLHDSILEGLGTSPNGFSMGNNGAAVRVKATGYVKTGIGLDRATGGGLLERCDLWGNGLKPNAGELEDGAEVKGAFVNGTRGVTDVEDARYVIPAAEFRITYCSFRAIDPATGRGGGRVGVWNDLDGHRWRIDHSSFRGYAYGGVILELGTDAVVEWNLFEDCQGFGPSVGQDYRCGAVTVGEFVRARIEGNEFRRCAVPLVIRQSHRNDMTKAPTRKYDVTYAWRGSPFAGDVLRPWIDPEMRKANASGTMSNLATAEIDVVTNSFDGGQILISGGSTPAAREAIRSNLGTIRFRGNEYAAAVRLWELENQFTPDTWRAMGQATGKARDQ